MSTPFYVGMVIGFIGWVVIHMQSQHYQYMLEMNEEESPLEPDGISVEQEIVILHDISQLKTEVEELKSNVSSLMLKAGFKV